MKRTQKGGIQNWWLAVSEGWTMIIMEGNMATGRRDARAIAKNLTS